MSLIQVTQRDGSVLLVEMNMATVAPAVDSAGAYLGLVELAPGVVPVSGPPPAGAGWLWIEGAWLRTVPLNELRAAALAEIDAAAGTARLRYISDVAGQQAVDIIKLDEARVYLNAVASDSKAPVPAHIDAEAKGVKDSPADVAQMIIDTAAQWNGVISPAIEGTRRGYREKMAGAETPADVAAVRDAALAALAAI